MTQSVLAFQLPLISDAISEHLISEVSNLFSVLDGMELDERVDTIFMSETFDPAAVMNKKPSEFLFCAFEREEVAQALCLVHAATCPKILALPNRNHSLRIHGVLRLVVAGCFCDC